MHQFFAVFFKFSALNLENIVEILMLFLEPLHYKTRNTQAIFGMFLQNLNTVIGSRIRLYQQDKHGPMSKFHIFEGPLSMRLYATFLIIVLLVTLQFGK